MSKEIKRIILYAAFICMLLAAQGLAATAQYTYDNLNRLVQVQYEDGTIIHYTYDAAGNRLAKEVTPTTPPEAPGGSSPLAGQGAIDAPVIQELPGPSGSQ